MPEDQKSSFSEAVETGTSAAHTICGAIKTGKAISSAAKGAAAGGPYAADDICFHPLTRNTVLTVQLQAQCGQVGSISEKSLWQSLPCLCCRYYLFSCSLVLFSVD